MDIKVPQPSGKKCCVWTRNPSCLALMKCTVKMLSKKEYYGRAYCTRLADTVSLRLLKRPACLPSSTGSHKTRGVTSPPPATTPRLGEKRAPRRGGEWETGVCCVWVRLGLFFLPFFLSHSPASIPPVTWRNTRLSYWPNSWLFRMFFSFPFEHKKYLSSRCKEPLVSLSLQYFRS